MSIILSQNGWRAGLEMIDRTVVIPGTDVKLPGGLNKYCAGLLLHFAARYHKEVEPLRDGWCWGYAANDQAGMTDVSNHASGTAIDLNAPLHPWKSRGTFSDAKATKIREILRDYNGIIRWGGDYQKRADEMHFEVVADAETVQEFLTLHRINSMGIQARPPVGTELDVDEATLRKIIREEVKGVLSAPGVIANYDTDNPTDTVSIIQAIARIYSRGVAIAKRLP